MAESEFRFKGYELLKGQGIEIGALNQAARIPSDCSVKYCDANSREEIISFFPELKIEDLVSVDYLCDLDREGLYLFDNNLFDFVIFNHVIEHVANPIKAVKEIFRIAKNEGLLVISAPDKDYTFDKQRALTPFEHILDDFENDADEASDEHYVDFLKAVHPEVFELSQEKIRERINFVKLRREHVHVWDSATFKNFLSRCLDILEIKANLLYESVGDENKIEYFSIWQKLV